MLLWRGLGRSGLRDVFPEWHLAAEMTLTTGGARRRKKGSTVVPYRRSTISPARVSGNWKEITRRKESNNTHSPRFTYVHSRKQPFPPPRRPAVRAGFDRKSHIAFYWVGYILPTGLFLLCSFLWLFFIPPLPHPNTLVHPAAVPCHLNTI